jgi:hypothetical protein
MSEWTDHAESRAKAFLSNRWSMRMLLMLAFTCCIRFWLHHPEPGIAIAVLGLLAAIMTFAEMTSTHKVLAILAMFILMIIEIRDIHKDKLESDVLALKERGRQDESFKEIREKQDADFNTTAQGVKEAIEGIKVAIKTATTTFEQTRPHADLHYTTGIFIVDSPTLLPFRPGLNYNFKSDFTNSGTQDAVKLRSQRKVGTPGVPLKVTTPAQPHFTMPFSV